MILESNTRYCVLYTAAGLVEPCKLIKMHFTDVRLPRSEEWSGAIRSVTGATPSLEQKRTLGRANHQVDTFIGIAQRPSLAASSAPHRSARISSHCGFPERPTIADRPIGLSASTVVQQSCLGC